MDNPINSSTQNPNFRHGRQVRRAKGIILAGLSGLIVAAIILRITDLNSRYLFGVLLAVPFFFAFAVDTRKFLFGVFLFLVPISLNIAPFHLDANQPFHSGGAQPTIQIWVSQLPLVVLLFFWGAEAVLRKKRFQLTPIDTPALLFIGWNGLSLFITTRLDLSLSHMFRLLMFYLVYLYIVNNLRDIRSLQFAAKVLMSGLLFEGLLAVAQYWFDLPFSMSGSGFIDLDGTVSQSLDTGQVNRVFGTLGWPNTFGLYIAMILPISFSMLLTGPLMRSKLALSSFTFGLVALALTFSRGAWIGALAGLFFVAFQLRRARQIKSRVLPVALVVCILIAFCTVFLGEQIYQRLTESPASASIGRLQLMEVALEMIKTHPFMGVGLNTFEKIMPNYDNTGVSRYFPKPVHNYFLLVAAETGLCGLIFFVVLLATSVWISIPSITKANTGTVALRIGCTAALLSCTLANLVDATLRKYSTGLLFWILLGLIGACWAYRERMLVRKKVS